MYIFAVYIAKERFERKILVVDLPVGFFSISEEANDLVCSRKSSCKSLDSFPTVPDTVTPAFTDSVTRSTVPLKIIKVTITF